MFCVNCGNKLHPQDKFCAKCGKEVNTNVQYDSGEQDKVENSLETIKDTPKDELQKSKFKKIYIQASIALAVIYFVISAMFIPVYGNIALYLLIISAFIVDALVLFRLKNEDTQDVFIIIGLSSFVATLFYALGDGEDAGTSLFAAMLHTFLNLFLAYLALLAIRKYQNEKYKEKNN